MRSTRVNPVYPVGDVSVSIEWYRRMFGWVPGHVNQAPDHPNYAVLVQDGASILHLLRKDEAPHGLTTPVEAQFWIDGDIDHVFTNLRALGAAVIEPVADRPWGHRDFIVADPDSNLVWITRPRSSSSAAVEQGHEPDQR